MKMQLMQRKMLVIRFGVVLQKIYAALDFSYTANFHGSQHIKSDSQKVSLRKHLRKVGVGLLLVRYSY